MEKQGNKEMLITEQINPQFSLRAQIDRFQLTYFGYNMQRLGVLKSLQMRKIKGKRRRGQIRQAS